MNAIYTSIKNKVSDIIIKEINNMKHIEQVCSDKPLSDYGIHSLKIVKILVTIEATFNLSIDDDDLNIERFPTMDSIIEYITENRKEDH